MYLPHQNPNISIEKVCKLPPDAMACLLNASGFSQTLRSKRAHRHVKRYTGANSIANNTSNYHTTRESKHTPRSPTKIFKKISWDPCLVYFIHLHENPRKMNQIVGKAATHESVVTFRVFLIQLGSKTSSIRARRRSPAPRRS